MKCARQRQRALVFCLGVFFLSALTAGNSDQGKSSLAKVSFMSGKASKRASKAKNWMPLKLHQKIKSGDWLKTSMESAIELSLKDGSVMRISEDAEVVISGELDKFKTDMKSGKIWGNIKKLGQKRRDFQVGTGTAVAAIRGTVFRMDKDKADSSTTVAVYNGNVDVGPDKTLKDKMEKEKQEKKAGFGEVKEEIAGPTEVPGPYEVSLEDWVSIVAGMTINIKPNGRYDKRKINTMADNMDSWVQFNQKRDADLRKNTVPE